MLIVRKFFGPKSLQITDIIWPMIDVRELFPEISDTNFGHAHVDVLRDIVAEIHKRLRGYNDLSPIAIKLKPNISPAEDIIRVACVRQLADSKIIYWHPDEKEDEYTDYVVTVVNRYRFEKLYLELSGYAEVKICEMLPNLVYYNALTGVGFIQGNLIRLKPKTKRKTKEVFDLLFAAAPNPVPRDKIVAVLRLGQNVNGVADELNEAFKAIRRACGVGADVIELNGSGILNAIAIPFEKIPNYFIFPE